jgi:hypothetical protein
VKPFVVSIVAAFLIAGCSSVSVEEGLFFPTWTAEGGPVPTGIVQGTLLEDDGCLYVGRAVSGDFVRVWLPPDVAARCALNGHS